MAEYVIQGETLSEIADAIREKSGNADQIPTSSMAEEILSLETTPLLQEKTLDPATVQQIVEPDAGYGGLAKVTVNAVKTTEQATPSISVDAAGLITATATQDAGYVDAGVKSAQVQLATQAAQIITPGVAAQAIAAGKYLTGTQTIAGSTNLKAENIKSGVNIFGVAGTLASVQKKVGAFTTADNGQASVVADFTPDCIAIYGGVWDHVPFTSSHVYTAAMFTEQDNDAAVVFVPPASGDNFVTVIQLTRYDHQVWIDARQYLLGSYDTTPDANRTFNYVMLKYT